VNDTPGPGPVTVLRVHKPGWPPGRFAYYLCPAKLAPKIVKGTPGAADIGPAFLLCQPAARHAAGFHLGGVTLLVLVGVANGNEWALWAAPAPVEPVPGSPGQAAQAN
jgi:hypothetical protein